MKIQATNKQDYYGIMGYLYNLNLAPCKGTGSFVVNFNEPIILDEEDLEDWIYSLTEMQKLFPFCDWKASYLPDLKIKL